MWNLEGWYTRMTTVGFMEDISTVGWVLKTTTVGPTV